MTRIEEIRKRVEDIAGRSLRFQEIVRNEPDRRMYAAEYVSDTETLLIRIEHLKSQLTAAKQENTELNRVKHEALERNGELRLDVQRATACIDAFVDLLTIIQESPGFDDPGKEPDAYAARVVAEEFLRGWQQPEYQMYPFGLTLSQTVVEKQKESQVSAARDAANG